MKSHYFLYSLIFLAVLTSGCTGWSIPQPFSTKPLTLIHGGDQLGRDQLANRYLAAQSDILLKGKNGNEVLTIMGQPQEILVRERNVSEDWYFVYYKRYKTAPKTDEGTLLVRFYQGEVIDTIKVS